MGGGSWTTKTKSVIGKNGDKNGKIWTTKVLGYPDLCGSTTQTLIYFIFTKQFLEHSCTVAPPPPKKSYPYFFSSSFGALLNSIKERNKTMVKVCKSKEMGWMMLKKLKIVILRNWTKNTFFTTFSIKNDHYFKIPKISIHNPPPRGKGILVYEYRHILRSQHDWTIHCFNFISPV